MFLGQHRLRPEGNGSLEVS